MTAPNGPATEPQMRLIDRLVQRLSDQDTLDGPSPRACAYKALSDGLTKAQASAWIEKLMELPAPEPTGDLKLVVDHLREQRQNGKLNDFGASLLYQFEQRGSLSEKQIACVLKRITAKTNAIAIPLIPAGRYAVTLPGPEMVLARIWRGTRDPSIQHVYVIRGHEDQGARLTGADEIAVTAAIAADPGKAAQEFGRRTGHCYRCGKELEKNLTRQLAIGPECMKHVFDDATRYALLAEARADLRLVGLDPNAKFDDLAVAA